MSCQNPCAVSSYANLIRTLSELPTVGLLTLYRSFGRDRPEYGGEAAWIGGALERYHTHDPDQRLIAVVEGWDHDQAAIDAQISQALAAGAAGFLVARKRLDQTWKVKPLLPPGRKI